MKFRFSRQALATIALGSLFLAALPSISNAAIYRCGNTYGQMPCANSIELDADDPRTDEQRRNSVAGQRMMKNLAREMEHDRLKFEAANKPYAGVVGLEKVGMQKADAGESKPKDKPHAKKDKRAVKPKTSLNTPAGAPFIAQSAGSAPDTSKKKPKKTPKNK